MNVVNRSIHTHNTDKLIQIIFEFGLNARLFQNINKKCKNRKKKNIKNSI